MLQYCFTAAPQVVLLTQVASGKPQLLRSLFLLSISVCATTYENTQNARKYTNTTENKTSISSTNRLQCRCVVALHKHLSVDLILFCNRMCSTRYGVYLRDR